jgi:hypothetical protein
MNFQDAIRKIEERGDFNRYAEVKPVFEEQLKQLSKGDHTERGLCYYYLLVSYLKAQLVHETEEAIEYYEKMEAAFLTQEREYRAKLGKFASGEVQDFYHLMERCYNSLEFLYQHHDFKGRRDAAYQQKMRFRKDAFFFNKQWGRFLEYKFFEITCNYGSSLLRWAITTFAFTVLFATFYLLMDRNLTDSARMIPADGHWYDYFYFSIIVTTTVGLGDIAPLTLLGKVLVSLEAFMGFMMLGIFMGLVQKKFF